jgi:hypothetical protein
MGVLEMHSARSFPFGLHCFAHVRPLNWPTGAGSALSCARSVITGVVPHSVHVDHFKPEDGDPLHEPGEGSLIGQLGVQGGRAWAGDDLAIIEFRAHSGAGLAGESDVISLQNGYVSSVRWYMCTSSVPDEWLCVITPWRVKSASLRLHVMFTCRCQSPVPQAEESPPEG